MEPWVESRRLAVLGRLLPSLVHQLSTPLASIALRAESLTRSARDGAPFDGERTRRYLEAMVTESGRCQDILGLVRRFARPGPDEVVDVDVNALCRDAARLVLHEAMSRQVEVALDLDAAAPPVRGNEGRLRQAVLALVVNAVDATASAGRATVSTRRATPGIAVLTPDSADGGSPGEEDLRAGRAIAEAHAGSLDREASPSGPRLVLRLPAAGPASPEPV